MFRILLGLIIANILISGILLQLGFSFYLALVGSLLINCLSGMMIALAVAAFRKQTSLKDYLVNRKRKN